MKKLIIGTGVFAFAFALTAGSALAWMGHHQYRTQSNYAHEVMNYIEASSSSGHNAIGKADINGETKIYTGNAVSSADGTNAINSNWLEMARMNSQKNEAKEVSNGIGSYSETGDNVIGKADIGGRRTPGLAGINTGNARSSASGMNLINTNVRMGGGWTR